MAIAFDVEPKVRGEKARMNACGVSLLALENDVVRALESGDESGLEVLGYGEVTLVLRLRTNDGPVAAKRLPLLDSRAAFDAYRAVSEEYVETLSRAGIALPPTRLWASTRLDGKVIGYVLQPELDSTKLGPKWLREATAEQADWFFTTVLTHVLGTITPRVGLDVQASNWIVDGDRLQYLDVTTPFLRDEQGRERLDARPFFSSLPWLLRTPVRLALGSSLFDKFYDPRGAIVDLLGNLYKERLEALVPSFLRIANERLSSPITEQEVQAYYAADAKMWSVLQKLRRADRWWQRSVRRRPYPFLLPGAIER